MYWLSPLIERYVALFERSVVVTDRQMRKNLSDVLIGLFEKSYITYPLTDTPLLSEEQRGQFFSQAMRIVSECPDIQEKIFQKDIALDINRNSSLFVSDVIGSHTAIMPLRASDMSLSIAERRFMAILSQEMLYDLYDFIAFFSVKFGKTSLHSNFLWPSELNEKMLPDENPEKVIMLYFKYKESPKTIPFSEWLGIDMRNIEQYKNGCLSKISKIESDAFLRLLNSTVEDGQVKYKN